MRLSSALDCTLSDKITHNLGTNVEDQYALPCVCYTDPVLNIFVTHIMTFEVVFSNFSMKLKMVSQALS